MSPGAGLRFKKTPYIAFELTRGITDFGFSLFVTDAVTKVPWNGLRASSNLLGRHFCPWSPRVVLVISSPKQIRLILSCSPLSWKELLRKLKFSQWWVGIANDCLHIHCKNFSGNFAMRYSIRSHFPFSNDKWDQPAGSELQGLLWCRYSCKAPWFPPQQQHHVHLKDNKTFKLCPNLPFPPHYACICTIRTTEITPVIETREPSVCVIINRKGGKFSVQAKYINRM